jgi:hypothetical protein
MLRVRLSAVILPLSLLQCSRPPLLTASYTATAHVPFADDAQIISIDAV